MVRLRLSGAGGSSYWLWDDNEVGAVVWMELVRSVDERVDAVDVVAFCRGVFV